MRRMTMVAMLVLACGGNSAEDHAQQLAEDAGAPGDAQVKSALAAGDIDTGGRVQGTVSGARSGSTAMTDVSFCVTDVSAGSIAMKIFALAANNRDWALNITNTQGMPTVGEHQVDPAGVDGGIIDKSTGDQPSEWQQYKTTGGTVTFTAADAQHVAGSYKLTGTPSYPKSSGPAVTMEGTFDAPPARDCDLAAAGIK